MAEESSSVARGVALSEISMNVEDIKYNYKNLVLNLFEGNPKIY